MRDFSEHVEFAYIPSLRQVYHISLAQLAVLAEKHYYTHLQLTSGNTTILIEIVILLLNIGNFV
jgi:hypothetical protein